MSDTYLSGINDQQSCVVSINQGASAKSLHLHF